MLYNIQILRALAAILVVTHHLDRLLSPVGLDRVWFNPGIGGVDVFFVISGFVMVHTTQRKPVGAGTFLLNRIIRVVPVYWLFTLLLAVACNLYPSLFSSTRASLTDTVKSLLFVPYESHPGITNPVLFVGWTLNYEMLFYLLFSAAILVSGRSVARTIGLTIAALVAIVAIGLASRPLPIVPAFLTAPIMLEFASGMLLAVAWEKGMALPRGLGAAALLAGLAALPVLAVAAPQAERALALGVPATLVVAGALSLERHGMRWKGRVGQLLGASSYSLYLTHVFVVMGIAKLSMRLNNAGAAWVLAIVAVAASCLVGVVVHLFLERPLTNRLRRLLREKPMAVEAAAPVG